MGMQNSASPHKNKTRKSTSSSKLIRNRREEHNRWIKLQTSGDLPSPRSGHDVTIVGNKVYLFGGCGGEHDSINCLNDMFAFDLDLHRWESVEYKGDVIPSPRASFGMCTGLTPTEVIVAGGTGVEMDSLRSDILIFNTKSKEWIKVTGDSIDIASRFYGQTVCRYENVLLLFGGSTGLHYTNDLFEYNITTFCWRKLNTSGKRPSPRYKHQSVVVGDRMYVIGGGCFKPEQSSIDLYCLDLKTLIWDEPNMNGRIPRARVAHSCCFDNEAKTIYLWGGFTGELSRLQDFFVYNTTEEEWTEIKVPSSDTFTNNGGVVVQQTTPYARAFHSAVFYEGALYVFSGANGDVRYNDVWRYTVRSTPPKLGILAARSLLHTRSGVQLMMALETLLPDEILHGVLNMNDHARYLT